MSHSVLAVANRFLGKAHAANSALTPMHLQKLCYFAHGFNLAVTSNPLVSDRIEAWDFGPVFPTLYDALRRYGSTPVDDLIHENNWAGSANVRGDVVQEQFKPDEFSLIGEVFDTYGDFEAFQLSALTHEAGSPWEKIYKPGKRHLEIPDRLIEEYFRELARVH